MSKYYNLTENLKNWERINNKLNNYLRKIENKMNYQISNAFSGKP